MTEGDRQELVSLVADLMQISAALADALKYLQWNDPSTSEAKRQMAERRLIKLAEKLRG